MTNCFSEAIWPSMPDHATSNDPAVQAQLVGYLTPQKKAS
jgi:hypothetical protein